MTSNGALWRSGEIRKGQSNTLVSLHTQYIVFPWEILLLEPNGTRQFFLVPDWDATLVNLSPANAGNMSAGAAKKKLRMFYQFDEAGVIVLE